jgi:alkanesulfonate monooxygenase
MTEFYWQLPVAGDNRSGAFDQLSRSTRPTPNATIRDLRRDRFNNFDYLSQVARAVELAGFDGLSIPDDAEGESSWVVAGVVAREVRRPKLIIEFSPGLGSAVYAAKQAVTFQRYSNNRLGWALESNADGAARRALGDFVEDGDVTARLEEFLTVSKGVASQADFTFKGRFFEVLNGGFGGPLSGLDLPEITLSGDSDEALTLSAKHADVHVFALGTYDLEDRVATLKAQAAEHGRTVRIAVKARVFTHDDAARARLDAERAGFSEDADTLAGDFAGVASELARLGADRFILFAPNSLETAYRIGEHVLPLVRQSQRAAA